MGDIAADHLWNVPNQRIIHYVISNLRIKVQPTFCVLLIEMTQSLEALEFILENMLFANGGIEKSAFNEFDNIRSNSITAHIRNIDPLYAFSLQWVGSNTMKSAEASVSDSR